MKKILPILLLILCALSVFGAQHDEFFPTSFDWSVGASWGGAPFVMTQEPISAIPLIGQIQFGFMIYFIGIGADIQFLGAYTLDNYLIPFSLYIGIQDLLLFKTGYALPLGRLRKVIGDDPNEEFVLSKNIINNFSVEVTWISFVIEGFQISIISDVFFLFEERTRHFE